MPLSVVLRRYGYRVAYTLLTAWWFVTRPELQGAKCVLSDGDRVLLVRHTYGHRRWDVPGGRVRRHEPPTVTASREIAEELGLQVRDWTALGELHVRDRSRRDTLHCFAAEVHSPSLTLDLGELERADWFPRDALPPDIGPFVDPILARINGRKTI